MKKTTLLLLLLAQMAFGQDQIKLGVNRFMHTTNSGIYLGLLSGNNISSGVGSTFIGTFSGMDNTTGTNNTFVGNASGRFNVSGSYNTYLGYDAGWRANGDYNVIIGRSAGGWATTGNNNTFVGTFAGLGVEANPNTGVQNTFMGHQSGFKNSSGKNNVFIGWASGYENTAGEDNTVLGTQAGGLNTTGGFNTNVGKLAGYNIVGGNYNVFVGAGADAMGTNKAQLNKSGAIGYNARVSVNDALVLGDFENPNLKVGIGVHDPQYRFEISGDINIRKNGSVPGRLRFSSGNFIHADEQDYLVLTAAQPGQSGLRFANLTNQAVATQTTNQFLSLDGQGRVGLYQPTLSARQVRLQVANPLDWADHVFAADYPLPSLKQVGHYIQTNGHLPHLPSAQTMTERGASVEELIKGLVKTQEEQARYQLQLQAENEQLRKENAEIRALLKQVLEKK